MKKFIISAFLLLIAGFAWFTFQKKTPKSEKKIGKDPQTMQTTSTKTPTPADYTASFKIYTLGTERIFTASMYHNLSDDVFIEPPDPSIIYVKKSGVSWEDFFVTLPFELRKDCLTTGTGQTFCTNATHELKFRLNGVYRPNALGEIIKEGDQLIVSYERL